VIKKYPKLIRAGESIELRVSHKISLKRIL
jgi:hypothetical protein